MAGKFKTTRYVVADRIATITLNRPEQLNAFSIPAMREFIAVLDAANSDDDVRMIIITGAGKAFFVDFDISPGTNRLRLCLVQIAAWTCIGFAPITSLITPPWLRRRAG